MVATTAKLVQVSDDSGSNWFTLPGGAGEFNDNAEQLDDTIFGHTFSSNQPGLLGWAANANALYKGFAGYVAKILQPGTPTVSDGEAMELESGKIFKTTDTAKNVWDRTDTVVVYDNAVDETANIEWIDYLFGRVKFLDSYTVNTPVTADITYFPMAQLGRGRSFTLTQTAAVVDETDFEVAQGNDGYRTVTPGLRTVALELGGVYDVASGLRALLRARTEVIIEVNPDGNSLSVGRGFFKPATESQSGNVGDLEVETATFVQFVPDEALMLTPFNWIHDAATTLSRAIQIILQSWIDQTIIDVQYLYDGTNGQTGTCMVADVSLTGGLEVMNEFAANFAGDDAPSDVGTG
jgi:hypothetical protein